MSAEAVALQREEMLTIQVKNTVLHLNGQNLRLAAKNGLNTKAPGLRLSATQGKHTAGRLTACSPTRGGAAQSGLLQLKSPGPDSQREAESRPLRRPPKLAPLELPEEVRAAQRHELAFIQRDAKPPSCKPDARLTEPPAGTLKSCVRHRPVKAAGCPPAPTETLKVQQQHTSARLTRRVPAEQRGDKHLGDVVCRGTPAPLRCKPAPPLLSRRVKAQAARGAEAARKNHSTPLLEEGRQRLRRAQRPEEDQGNSNTSTGGLPADKGKPAQGAQGKGQRPAAERAQPHARKGFAQHPPGSADVLSGKAIKRIAVSNLQDAL